MKLRATLPITVLLLLSACSSTSEELSLSTDSSPTTIASTNNDEDQATTTTSSTTTNSNEGSTPTTTRPPTSLPFSATTISANSSRPVIVPVPQPEVTQVCSTTTVQETDQIEASQLSEISGAVWAREGLWVHNDAGNSQEIYLIGAPGTAAAGDIVRTIDLSDQLDSPLLDAEDIAIVEGDLLVADTGNNSANGGRDDIQLIRINRESEQVVSTYTYTFPSGSGDVEALLYDTTDQAIYLIEKARTPGVTAGITGAANIYSAPLTETDQAIELTVVGQLDLGPETLQLQAELHPNREGQLQGIVTAADISPDGNTIAIRTYDTVWVYVRSQGQSVVQALQTVPCETAVNPEPQGEAVAFDRTSDELRLATISEASNQPINVITR